MAILRNLVALGLASSAMAQEFSNPVIWEDLPDNEVIRVGEGENQAHICCHGISDLYQTST